MTTDLIDAALARQDARAQPRPIDYERMKREHPKQKAALTRAIKTGDPERIAATIKTTVAQWDVVGAWPDDWSRWQRALDDAIGWGRLEISQL